MEISLYFIFFRIFGASASATLIIPCFKISNGRQYHPHMLLFKSWICLENFFITIVNYRELINSNYQFFDKSRMCSFSRIVSLSITISFLSIDITSPVSSSTKSSIQLFKTRAANFLPSIFFRHVLVTFISSARSKISKISRSC